MASPIAPIAETHATDIASPAIASPRRRWAFRLLAILLGLSPLLAFEAACRWVDWGRPNLLDDPFVGFRATQPLFVTTAAGARREIPHARHQFFCQDSFAVPKPPGEFRAFVLGGSTVQGHPFAIDTAFSRWLEISLTAADPERTWRIVNCGGVSYATYRIVPILQEVLQYEPDLIVFCEGHNEFLEARTFAHVAGRGALLNSALAGAEQLRTFTLLREGYLRMRRNSADTAEVRRTILPTEVEALLDYRGGLEEYHRDDAWRQGVIEQFRYNLGRIVELCREHGVPLILVSPVSKLRDSPPFKSEHGAVLSSSQIERWEQLIANGHRHLRREHYDPYQSLDCFQEACKLDPDHAGGFYNLAQCRDLLGQYAAAKAAYIQAKDLDVCPLRMLEPMREAMAALARQEGVPIIDAQSVIEARSNNGIAGGDWLVDHVHPKIEGHQLLADELANVLVTQGVVTPGNDWRQLRTSRYREHFESLNAHYFHQGMQRLKGLEDWAAGRAKQLKPTSVGNSVSSDAAAAVESTPTGASGAAVGSLKP
jgi:lysophospholipase L1-like esterase